MAGDRWPPRRRLRGVGSNMTELSTTVGNQSATHYLARDEWLSRHHLVEREMMIVMSTVVEKWPVMHDIFRLGSLLTWREGPAVLEVYQDVWYSQPRHPLAEEILGRVELGVIASRKYDHDPAEDFGCSLNLFLAQKTSGKKVEAPSKCKYLNNQTQVLAYLRLRKIRGGNDLQGPS